MLFDTYAWIELFIDSEKGRKAAVVVASGEVVTASPTISEVVSWAYKNNLEPGKFIKIIRESSAVLPLTDELAELAGTIYYANRKTTKDWGMIDSMIYATALHYHFELLTGDKHFQGKPGAVML